MSQPQHNTAATAAAGPHNFERIRRLEIIDEQMAAILRQKTDAERLRSVDAFRKSARAVLRAVICTERSDWDAQAIDPDYSCRPEQIRVSHSRHYTNATFVK